MAIRVVLRPHREAIAALTTEGFEVEPVRFSRGDHLVVRVRRDGGAAKITLSGSPGGCPLHSIITAAKRAVREAASR
ncbi:hypothetical protein P9A47_gp63 [Xanthomonas phage Elanor]|uniref:Uncharacterized protein n=1 Tax=Xanthomonas phage Elanor TaxID=2939127 RepID=A0A9E7J5B1_9CAUD|nr:hypothetical protein P9A47_gp63 [Xanthomonas phage Elanor]URA07031.1 hypothetical protein Elanor_BL40063 [Xanthomonas phage Elanor]